MKRMIRNILNKFSLGRTVCEKLSNISFKYRLRKNNKLQNRNLHKFGPEAVRYIVAAMKSCHIEFIADYGTLLGFVRDNGFIKHDIDMDFSVLSGMQNYKRLVCKLIDCGFSFVHAFDYEGTITEITVRYKGITIDFFNMGRIGDKNYTQFYTFDTPDGDALHRPGIRHFRPNIAGLGHISVYGVDVPVPSNYDEFLSTHYGNWKVRDNKWNYAHDGRVDTKMKLDKLCTILNFEGAMIRE